jgi:hypothetical protein
VESRLDNLEASNSAQASCKGDLLSGFNQKHDGAVLTMLSCMACQMMARGAGAQM